MGNHVDVDDNNEETADDVDNSHERNDEIREIRYALQAAQEYSCHENGNGNTDDIRIDGKGRVDSVRNFRCLNGRGKHHASRHGNSPDDGEPAPVIAQAVFDVPRETAVPNTGYRVFFTIGQAEGYFGELNDQTEHSNEPHPEDSAGTDCSNGDRNAGNVANAQGRGQGRTGCLKGVDIAFTGTFVKDFVKGILHDVTKIGKLEETESGRQEYGDE